ncbi:MAG: GNAT family N-acetyltransferase, partial [Candidatus Binataceae bacterium]
MAQAVHARLDAQFDVGRAPAADHARAPAAATVGDIRLTIHGDLAALEQDWRAFERHADGTVFQTFAWLSTWQRTIGARSGVTPAIVAGRDNAGTLLFLIPLSTRMAGIARELSWLGADLCDYNAPLLAPGVSERLDRANFLALWDAITQRLRCDLINLTKMPEMVGAQPNPMRHPGGTVNPSGAYLTHLAGDWDAFYAAKRSSSTRRRDRTKRKKLAELGAVKLVNLQGAAETLRTLDTLMAQKSRSFARMGVANLFA